MKKFQIYVLLLRDDSVELSNGMEAYESPQGLFYNCDGAKKSAANAVGESLEWSKFPNSPSLDWWTAEIPSLRGWHFEIQTFEIHK